MKHALVLLLALAACFGPEAGISWQTQPEVL